MMAFADEAADSLVEVVRPTQQRARGDRVPGAHAEIAQPGQQVADDHDLLDHCVACRREDEHRRGPPQRRQVRGGGDRRVDPMAFRGRIEGDPRDADRGRENRAGAKSNQGRRPLATSPGRAARALPVVPPQQVYGQQRRNDVEETHP
jgi:hypothetical protein